MFKKDSMTLFSVSERQGICSPNSQIRTSHYSAKKSKNQGDQKLNLDFSVLELQVIFGINAKFTVQYIFSRRHSMTQNLIGNLQSSKHLFNVLNGHGSKLSTPQNGFRRIPYNNKNIVNTHFI